MSAEKSARGILKTLKRKYPRKSAPPARGVTYHLAAAIVGRDSPAEKTFAACRKMLLKFVNWNEVRVARHGEVERTLRPHLDERRSGEAARRLVYCLQQIFQTRGSVSLDGFARTSPADARKYLLELDFLSRDEVNLVLLLGLGDAVMPVDSDMLRAGKRLGVISHTATKLQAQRALEQSLAGEDLHACYVALREHARRFCSMDSPECPACPLRKQCRPGRVH